MRPIRLVAPLGCCLVLAVSSGVDATAGTPPIDDHPSRPKRPHARPGERPPPSHSSHAAGTTPDGTEHGVASYYAHHLSGRRTASGQAYDPQALTAAHRTLPLGTQVRVVNPKNDKSVVVTVNDRGPVAKNRMIDVSSAAADRLEMKKSGVTRVETRVVGKDSTQDDRTPQ